MAAMTRHEAIRALDVLSSQLYEAETVTFTVPSVLVPGDWVIYTPADIAEVITKARAVLAAQVYTSEESSA